MAEESYKNIIIYSENDISQYVSPILEKSEEHGLCTMFLFDGITHPDVLHVTHKYFGKDYKDSEEIVKVLKAYFKEKPFKEFTEKFEDEEFLGEDKDIRVLLPKSKDLFLLDLKDKLDELKKDKWPEYKPHASVSANVDKIDYPIVDYVLVKGGDVLWSAAGNLKKAEDLHKSPIGYKNYEPMPSLPNVDDMGKYGKVKEVKLPNGLVYKQHYDKDRPGTAKRSHTLFDSSGKTPLAYMETENESDPMSENGTHWPNRVGLAQVDDSFKGKGLGRQLYLAALVHGTRNLTSDSLISPDAHKAWLSFRGLPGIGGRIGKYKSSPSPNEAAAYESDRHMLRVDDPKRLNHDLMFPSVDLFGENVKKNDEESSENKIGTKKRESLNDIRDILEAPEDAESIDIPEHIQIQWSIPAHRWENG